MNQYSLFSVSRRFSSSPGFMKKRFLENFVSEDRYSPIQGFIWHKEGCAYPGNDVHQLGLSDLICDYKDRSAVAAKDGLMDFVRKFGANALIDARMDVLKDEKGDFVYKCSGRPALYARPDYDGAYSESQMRSMFVQPTVTTFDKPVVGTAENKPGVTLKEYKEGVRSAIFFYAVTIVMMGPLRSALVAILLALLMVAFHYLRISLQRVRARLCMAFMR